MSPLVLHNFTDIGVFLKSFVSQNFKFDISENWEIPVLKDDDVVWNTVLAYLNSFPQSKNDLTRRLNCLIGNRRLVEDVGNFRKKINPFLHRTLCFGDEFMIDIVKTFKTRLENRIQNKGNYLEILSQKERYLEASSRILSCNIIVISFLNDPQWVLHVFPRLPPLIAYPKCIILLHCSGVVKHIDSFSYCIPKNIGEPKQKLALREILDKADISQKDIQKICGLPNICENFLTTLLKRDSEQNIQLIYKSLYVLSKLNDAGFETDPTKKDIEGKSALYYALMIDKSDLLFILYDHAANACLQAEGSTRSPDPIIVENLLCLKGYLQSLEEDIKSSEVNEQSEFLRKLNEVQQFNKFQIEMCGKINNVRQQLNYYFETEEFETSQRREIILQILEIYGKYFHCIKENVSNSKDELSLFENYYQNRNYFDKLDFCSTVMFFDNSFLLKERLKLEDNAYLEIESKFFLFTFCKKQLEEYYKENKFVKESRWIAFQEQLSLQKQISIFKNSLEEIEISQENMITSVPETQVYTLVNLPEIYGQFLLYRLQNYLHTVAEIQSIDDKSALIIERSLQVIGESFKESNFKSIQKVLSHAFPDEFVKIAKQIRNNLIHFTFFDLPHRNAAEHNSKLLKGIQDELAFFLKLLSPICLAHSYQMGHFLNLMLLKALKKARKKEKRRNETQQESETTNHRRQNSALQSPESNEVNNAQERDMYYSLQSGIKTLNQGIEFLKKGTINSFEYTTKNLISAVKAELMLLESENLIMAEDKRKLDELFWSLESFLVYLTKDKKLKGYRRVLLNEIKSRKCLFSGIKRKKRYSRKFKECLDSNTNEISNAEASIVEQTQIDSCTEPNDGSNDKEAQNNAQNTIRFEGATNYKNASTVEESEEQISIDVFEDIELSTFFSCDSNNEEFCNVKEEEESFDTIGDVSESDLPIKAKQDENKTSIGDNANAFKTSLFSRKDSENSKTKSNQYDETATNNTVVHSEWNLNEVFNISQDSCTKVKNLEIEDSEEISNILIKTAKEVVANYEDIVKRILVKIKGKREIEFSYENIKKYWKILKGLTFLSDEEINTIMNSIPERFWNIPSTKQKLATLLKEENIRPEEIANELDKLPLKDKEKKEIVEDVKQGITDHLYSINLIPDYFSELELKIKIGEMKKTELDLFCDKLKIPDDSKVILKKIVIGHNSKVTGNMFEFFRNRIKLLKKILIDENESIKELWGKATSLRKKKYVHERLVQIYINDSEVRASLEMLLSDCMTILDTKDLKKLWLKTTNLFNGISLRNVIAHGNPLLESLGRLLDPNDLPFELVNKMLNLISDEPAIDCMHEVLQQTGYEFSKFIEVLQNNEDEQFKDLRKIILECERWKDYAILIRRKN